MIRRRGVADQTVFFVARDASNDPFTLAYNTAGIAVEYYRPGASAVVAITPATQTASGAHSDGGLIHISKGLVRLDLPDAACAAGVNEVFVNVAATGMKTLSLLIELVDADVSLAPSTPTEIAAAVEDIVIEQDELGADVTLADSLRLHNGILGAESTNGGKTYRNLADTKNRLAATIDGSNNRTSISRDLTP